MRLLRNLATPLTMVVAATLLAILLAVLIPLSAWNRRRKPFPPN